MTPEMLWAKTKVVAGNLLTWLMAAQVALTFLIASNTLGDWPDVLQYATLALAVISGAITFIRRVTPVPEQERGLLEENESAISAWPKPRRRYKDSYQDPYKDPSPWA